MFKLYAKTLLIGFFALLALLGPTISSAQLMKNLYETKVLVPNQSDGVRDQAINQALGQVLIKVSGNPDIKSIPLVKKQMLNSLDAVQQFSYETRKNNNGTEDTFLVVHFEPQPINKLLQDTKQAIWGSNRPSLLLWLAIESQQGPNLLNENNDGSTTQTIKQFAYKRGLPILLPMLDLEDIKQNPLPYVWNMQELNLKPFTQRYQSDGYIVAKLYTDMNQQWQIAWKLVLENETNQGDANAKDQDSAVNNMLSQISTILARRYSVLSEEADKNDLSVNISGIASASDLAKTIKYLRSLNPVKQVAIKTIESENVSFVIQLAGNRQSFIDAVNLGKTLTSDENPQQSINQSLRYTLHHEPKYYS